MINKNDLRFVKTEKVIEDTYIKLKTKRKGNVKVNELCKEALINKSTFYSHYDSIESLNNYLGIKEVRTIIEECGEDGFMLQNVERDVGLLVESIKKHEANLIAFFQSEDSRINAFEDELLKLMLSVNKSKELEMKIKFGIGGAARLLVNDLSEEQVKVAIELINKIID